MDNETIELKKENVQAAYKAANGGQKKMLEALFGKELFKPKGVMERVKTFEDACKELGENHPLVKEYLEHYVTLRDKDVTKDFVAYLQLRIITAALNEGWEPQFTKDEWRYFPWFVIYSKEELEEMDDEERSRVVGRADYNANAYGGLVCASALNASSYSNTNDGSRLAFKSKELAVYCGKQFIDIWADYVC